MNVKISVKKLHRMEKMWKQRCKSDRRRYGREVRGWRHENEQLRESNKAYREKVAEMFNDREDFKNKVAEADASLQRMDERIEAYQQEIEDLKKDRDDWEEAARSAADNL